MKSVWSRVTVSEASSDVASNQIRSFISLRQRALAKHPPKRVGTSNPHGAWISERENWRWCTFYLYVCPRWEWRLDMQHIVNCMNTVDTDGLSGQSFSVVTVFTHTCFQWNRETVLSVVDPRVFVVKEGQKQRVPASRSGRRTTWHGHSISDNVIMETYCTCIHSR